MRLVMRRPLLQLLRPAQWIKNGFVLAPLVFTEFFLNVDAIKKGIWATIFFCIAASAGYVLNDLLDLEDDRVHAQKRYTRPLATGDVSVLQALVLLFSLYALLLTIFFFQPAIASVLLTYLLLNIFYSLRLKHMPVVDLFTIAVGFVLRVYAGAVALSVSLSFWMFITTFCLALYLASIKRRQELLSNGSSARDVLYKYTVPLLDFYSQTAAVGAIVFYGLFVATVRPSLVVTTPFVLLGLFRYQYIAVIMGAGESLADTLRKDAILALTVVAWLVLCMYVIWRSSGAA